MGGERLSLWNFRHCCSGTVGWGRVEGTRGRPRPECLLSTLASCAQSASLHFSPQLRVCSPDSGHGPF